jgi:hypothetical protein
VVLNIWSKISRVLGGLLLLQGGIVTVGLTLTILVSQATGGWLIIQLILLVFFGISPTALGGWLLYNSSKAMQQVLRDRFFQMLQAQRGRLSVREFASAARLEPAIARHHLDTWAKELVADFEVTDNGEVYYVFEPKR